MAIAVWVGSSSSDWNTAGNWSTNAVPGATDTAVFNAGAHNVVAASAITNIATLKVLEGFEGKLGSAATPLAFDATNVFIKTTSAEVNLDGTFTDFNAASIKQGGDAVFLGTSTAITNLNMFGLAGTITVAGGTITTARIQASHGLTFTTTGVGITTFQQDSGIANFGGSATATTATLTGGDFRLTGAANVTTLDLFGLSVANCNGSGTVTTANVFDRESVLSTAQNAGGTGTTFTNVNLHEGTVDEQNGAGTTVFTNAIAVKGTGLIKVDVGRTVAVN